MNEVSKKASAMYMGLTTIADTPDEAFKILTTVFVGFLEQCVKPELGVKGKK